MILKFLYCQLIHSNALICFLIFFLSELLLREKIWSSARMKRDCYIILLFKENFKQIYYIQNIEIKTVIKAYYIFSHLGILKMREKIISNMTFFFYVWWVWKERNYWPFVFLCWINRDFTLDKQIPHIIEYLRKCHWYSHFPSIQLK